MAQLLIERLETWPKLEGDKLVPTLTRTVDHMLKSKDARRALQMCYDDGSFSLIVKPSITIMVEYCERHFHPTSNIP